MKKVIDRIVKSPGSPGTHDLWLTDNNELKVYDNEEWKTIAGGDGSDGGDSSEITLAQALTKVFRLDKKIVFQTNKWVYTDETIPLPDFVVSINGDMYIIQQYFDRTKTTSDYGITIPSTSVNNDDTVYEYTSDISEDNCIIVPFNEFDEQHILYDSYGYSGTVYFLYSIDKLSDSFDGGYRYIISVGNPGDSFRPDCQKNIFFMKYNGQLYFFNAYEGD